MAVVPFLVLFYDFFALFSTVMEVQQVAKEVQRMAVQMVAKGVQQPSFSMADLTVAKEALQNILEVPLPVVEQRVPVCPCTPFVARPTDKLLDGSCKSLHHNLNNPFLVQGAVVRVLAFFPT